MRRQGLCWAELGVLLGYPEGNTENGRNNTMNPMTKQITDYINSAGLSFSKFSNKFAVEIAGEDYVIQRLGLRCWTCKNAGRFVVFRSQHEVIDWLDSRW